MRGTDHTVLLLRKFRQIDQTRNLLVRQTHVNESILAATFAETDWADIRRLLSDIPPDGWIRLGSHPTVLSQIGKKARQSESRITRFDLELVAWVYAFDGLDNLLVSYQEKKRTFTKLGEAIRQWVTSDSAADARNAAVIVFKEAWEAARNFYNLSPLSEYFENLPAMEAIASAVHYEIDKKFYRDHLSHNIRAALLSARLAHALDIPLPDDIQPCRISFFSGLFHDIAFPVVSFPDTVDKLAAALSTIQMAPTTFRSKSLLETGFLQLCLHYVALLSSVPGLLQEYPSGCSPWDRPDEAISPVDKRLLQEMLLCSKSEDHSIISAAILFHRAVTARAGEEGNIDSGVRTLMVDMTGSAATPKSKELLAILQSIALHDRKESLKYHPVTTVPRDAPYHLTWQKFSLPMVTIIADEFQEWGRPVGELEGVGIVDGTVKIVDKRVEAWFVWNTDPKTFEKVPYSLLYMLLGKLRICGQLRYENDGERKPFSLECQLDQLSAFHLEYLAHRDFKISFKDKAVAIDMESWPLRSSVGITGWRRKSVSFSRLSFWEWMQGHDYLILEGDLSACQSVQDIGKEKMRFEKMKLRGKNLEIHFEGGSYFNGQIIECYFGEIENASSAPTGRFPLSGSSCVIRLKMDRAGRINHFHIDSFPINPHNMPHPHFLDFDWRFTEETAKWIVKAANYYANGDNICYLGCPTIAIWQALRNPDSEQWLLLDRGHFALDKWVQNKMIPAELWRAYDVFDPLPTDFKNTFAVVVTDPPWYQYEYEYFTRRAAELVKRDGLVFISSYPPFRPYKPDKHSRFTYIVKRILTDPNWLGSMEIDYETPEFEMVWGGHKQFQHLGFGVYRPAYMDVFRVTKAAPIETYLSVPRQKFLPNSHALNGGHHMRYRDPLTFPTRVRIERLKSLKHVKEIPQDYVGWTSANAIVRTDHQGQRVMNIDELIDLVESWESKQQRSRRKAEG